MYNQLDLYVRVDALFFDPIVLIDNTHQRKKFFTDGYMCVRIYIYVMYVCSNNIIIT